jgi:hypothetical protein
VVIVARSLFEGMREVGNSLHIAGETAPASAKGYVEGEEVGAISSTKAAVKIISSAQGDLVGVFGID